MFRNGMFIVFWMIVSFCVTVIALPIIIIIFLVRITGKFIKKQKIIYMK